MADISQISIKGTGYNLKDTAAYKKPTGGIPATDLAQAILSKLTKVDGIEEGAQKHIAPTSSEIVTALGFTPTDNIGTVTQILVGEEDLYESVNGTVSLPAFLTSHLSLSNYATKTFVDNKFKDAFGINASGVSDLAAILSDNDYATGILSVIAGKVDKNGTDRLMTADEGTKLSGIETGALVHKAPTSTEVKTALGTGTNNGTYLRKDGTWQTPLNDNTTYGLSVGTGSDANKIILTPSSGTANKITVPYASNAGTVNGKTVAENVPSGAKFTDTTYESKTAVSGGTDVSLVTTGEKYNWNNKYSKPSGGIPSTDLASAIQTSLGKANTALQSHQSKSDIGLGNVTNDAQVKRSEMGAANGVATLGSDGKVPSTLLPSYVDDVLEYNNKSSFPSSGELGKIYVDLNTNTSWRWSGTAYVQIKGDLTLGETSNTAYRGDRGKIAYDHSLAAHARTDATKVEASTTNGNIKINGTETTIYTHPAPTSTEVKSALGTGTNDGTFLRKDGTWATPSTLQYSEATTSNAGLMSSSDKTKLNGIESGAQVHKAPTSTEITSALGYTPYNATNPNGYTSNTGTVTQVKVGTTAYNPSSGIVSLPAYPTSLPANGGNAATVGGFTVGKNVPSDAVFTDNNTTYQFTQDGNTLKMGTNGGTKSAIYTPTFSAPVSSVAGKTGAVTLNSGDVGLGNVGNFKAVSTVASQGLTSAELSNARANIGAGTSNFSGNYNDLSNKPSVMGASGSGHSSGLVPDTPSTAGTTKFLREDGTWVSPTFSVPGVKIYLDYNNASLTTSMFTSANAIYVISYNYDLDANTVTIPSGCALEFAGGSINGGTLVLNNTYLYGNIKFGTSITVSGTCKNDIIYQKWFINNNIDAWHRLINNISGPSIYEYTNGEYSSSVYVNKIIPNKKCITINGNGAIIKFPYSASEKSYYIAPEDAESSVNTYLTSAAYKGDIQILVYDASSFNVNDVVTLRDESDYSFSPQRSTYRQCEFVKIRSISGNTITLAQPIMGTYKNLSGTSRIYKFNQIICNINDITIGVTSPSEVVNKFFGLYMEQLIGGQLRNVTVNDSRTGILLSASYNLDIINCNVSVTTNLVSDLDSYGITLGGCQNINIIGGNYTGGNHAISVGGANSDRSVIGRQILIKNIYAKSIKDGFPAAIDMHGCAEFVTIEGCTTAGIYLRGQNNKILNNYIYDSSISCGEMSNFNHVISGNIMKIPSISIDGTVTNQSAWVKDASEENFVVSNNNTFNSYYTESNNQRTGQLYIFVSSSITDTYYNILNTHLIILDNNIKNGLFFITGFDTVIIRDNVFTYDSLLNTTINSKPKIYCNKLFVESNKFIGYGHNPYNTNLSETKTWSYNNITAPYIYVRNNYAESTNPDTNLFQSSGELTEIHIEGNIAKSKFIGITHTLTNIIVRNNTIEPEVHGINISTGETVIANKAIVVNNIVSAKKSIIVWASNVVYGRNIIMSTFALTLPHVLSNATLTNLDSASNVGYSAVSYDVATTSANSNTSGSVTIDGSKAVTVLALTGNVTSLTLATNPAAGHSAHVILTSTSARTVTIAHNSTTSICPGGANLTLSVPANGYVEVDFANINSKIYVRGV